MKTLQIEPTSYENFIAPLSGSLSSKGYTLPTGRFIPSWTGISDQVVVMSTFEGGIDTGMRLKLFKPMSYRALCTVLDVTEGFWFDIDGNLRELKPYAGTLKRVFAPKVAA